MQLAELASLIRSKNAGPFMLTFDILFADAESYFRVKRSGVLTVDLFDSLYHCGRDNIRRFECDNAFAFKFSIPRPFCQGELGDGDLHGGQQFAPLMSVEIP